MSFCLFSLGVFWGGRWLIWVTSFPLPPSSCARLTRQRYSGPLYYLYMSLLSTFSTNSINILAGLNGLEGIQALIIALSIALNDLLYIPWSFSFNLSIAQDGKPLEFGGVYGAGLSRGSPELVERHLLSLYFMIPLVGVLSGFLWHNWFVPLLSSLLFPTAHLHPLIKNKNKGTQPERSQETPSATSQECHSR
jgi:UDP-N-acetylmuramyl pentapeptide phosphotransferase/UDP-N-acetylglucosamine-1-phosphate transferase